MQFRHAFISFFVMTDFPLKNLLRSLLFLLTCVFTLNNLMDIYYEKNIGLLKICMVTGCVCVIALSFFFTYLKVETGPGIRVIATGYPVPKTGNAANQFYRTQCANHYYFHLLMWKWLSCSVPIAHRAQRCSVHIPDYPVARQAVAHGQ